VGGALWRVNLHTSLLQLNAVLSMGDGLFFFPTLSRETIWSAVPFVWLAVHLKVEVRKEHGPVKYPGCG